MLPPNIQVEVKKINLREKTLKSVKDHVATEVPINIYVNNQPLITLFSSPIQIKELAIGWLLSQSIIKTTNEIEKIQIEENNVKISCINEVEARIKARTTRMVNSSCGSTVEDFLYLIDKMKKPYVTSSYKVKAEKILEFIKVLNEKATIFKSTGGTHSAAIFHLNRIVAFTEDVGRHNAVDKAIGLAALKKVDFSRCVLVSSGRQPANMILKAARVGIPIIASIAAPIYSGIQAATKTGITLICFVRKYKMNVYSHPERIIFDNSA